MKKKFIRTDSNRHIKLGRRRKKLLRWRRPKGRHNKIRENRFGYPKSVRVGFKSDRKKSGRINGMVPIRTNNLKDLEGMKKNEVIIIGKVGAKKKIEMIKKAKEMNLKIHNLRKK